jgi:hypothetical protein
MSKNYLNNVTVIIRSVGERTEAVCKKLILDQGVPSDSVFVIKESPFSKAMRVGSEIGISQAKPWTLCIDADVLLAPNSIEDLIVLANKQPKNVCEIQAYVLDKFFGGARQGGGHLYRTDLLDKVISSIPEEGIDIRPEKYALNVMKKNGYPWVSVPIVVGLHDFEQSYEDIFRKCFVHAHKHLQYFNLFIPFWRQQAHKDLDYKIALSGFAAGVEHTGEVRIDDRAEYFKSNMESIGVISKDELKLSDWSLQYIEKVITEWNEPVFYWYEFPTGMQGSSNNLLKRLFLTIKYQSRVRGFFLSVTFLVSLMLLKIVKKLNHGQIIKK